LISFIQLYRWCPSVLKAMMIIRPETLVRWHRAVFRRYWRWKSHCAGGRPHFRLAALDWPQRIGYVHEYNRDRVGLRLQRFGSRRRVGEMTSGLSATHLWADAWIIIQRAQRQAK
jgi:hypothetical protein